MWIVDQSYMTIIILNLSLAELRDAWSICGMLDNHATCIIAYALIYVELDWNDQSFEFRPLKSVSKILPQIFVNYGAAGFAIELNWIELNWIELHSIALNWIELNWIELNWTDTSLQYSTVTEGSVSNDYFRHSLDDSQTSYSTQVPNPSLNTVELIVIHNRPCKHSSKLQLFIRFTPRSYYTRISKSDIIPSSISFINIKNNNDPSAEPRGTPI